jgi:hypothetical protein
MPNVNLISNIGFGNDSAYTSDHNKFSNMKTDLMLFPIKNLPFMTTNIIPDKHTLRNNFKNDLCMKKMFFRVVNKTSNYKKRDKKGI